MNWNRYLSSPVLIGITMIAVVVVGGFFLPEGTLWPAGAGAKTSRGALHRGEGYKFGAMRLPPMNRAYPPRALPPQASPSETPVVSPATVPSTEPASQPASLPDKSGHMTGDFLGERAKLEAQGVALDLSLTTYLGNNFTGGANTYRTGFAYELNFGATIDTSKLLNWDGGTFFTNFRAQEGLVHSMDGSFGDTSHLYEPRRIQLLEIWYQQALLDGKINVKFGKIDANEDFDNVANGGDFLNDFATYSATVLAFPTDPDPACGADFFFNPTDNFYVGVGVFDGSLLDGISTGSMGPATLFDGQSLFVIGEIGARWTLPGARAGRLGFGLWDHTGSIDRLDGSGTVGGTSGPYLSFDQTLWKKNPDDSSDNQGIGLFMLAGYANPNVSEVNAQVSGGLQWTGMIPSRPSDVAGLGAGLLCFSRAPGTGLDEDSETTVETFYKVRVNPWFSVEPDLQYIHNPGGTSAQHDAVAGTVQMIIDF